MTEDDEALPPWMPLTVRGDAEAEAAYGALHEGVPDWLDESLWRWIGGCSPYIDDLTLLAQRVFRRTLTTAGNAGKLTVFWRSAEDRERLSLVDLSLSRLERAYTEDGERHFGDNEAAILEHLGSLDDALFEGGSAWRVVVEPRWALERRVGQSMQAMADQVRSPDTDAAKAIAGAWRACYGLEPDADKAYTLAVKAVEAVVLPLTSVNDRQATLGKALSHIADTRSRWSVGGLDDERQPSADTLLAMLRSLWHNQERHAANDGTIRGVSAGEAEAAVSLAVTLMHWFTKGVVARS